MEDSPKRKRKSTKGRRRSLRYLQPADLLENHDDLPANNQQLYGSIWLDQAESPLPAKPRRRSSICNARISHQLNKENVYKPLEKETFTPISTLSKRVEIAPERTPVFIKNAWNNENVPEENRTADFWQKGQDESMSVESCKKTVDILKTDDKYTKHEDEIIKHELQLSDDFLENEHNKMNLTNKSLTSDQLGELVTTVIEPIALLSHQDYFLDPAYGCSGSTNNLVDNFSSLTSPSETHLDHSCLPIVSGKQSSSIPQKDTLRFSPDLSQDFQHLNISGNVCTENDLQGNILDDGFYALNQNSIEASDSSSPDNDISLNKGFSQTLNSSYSNNDVSSLNDSRLSESLYLWETDLSSAGSELSDSWCFSRHLNPANDSDLTPCKADDSKMAPKIDNCDFVESEKDLIFPAEDEIKEYLEIVGDSSVRVSMKEEEDMPAIEYLSLDDHFPSDLNKEHQTRVHDVHEESRSEENAFCVFPHEESVKIPPAENIRKNLTGKTPDSKIPKLRISLKGVSPVIITKRTTNSPDKSSSSQPVLNKIDNNSFKSVTKLTSRTKKQSASVNAKKSAKYSSDPNKLVSTRLNKNVNDEKILNEQKQNSYKRPSALANKSRNATQIDEAESKLPSKAVSPDVLIFDSSKRRSQSKVTRTMKSKTETAKNASQLSSEPPSIQTQRLSKKTRKSLPTVKTPRDDSNLSQSPQHTTYQQEDSEPVIVSTDEVPTKVYFVETFSEQKWLKGSDASAAAAAAPEQSSSVTITAAETNGWSHDRFSTSNITMNRRNTKPRKKSIISTTRDAKAPLDVGSEENISQASGQGTKLKRKSPPVLETADVAVVDLESVPRRRSSRKNSIEFSLSLIVENKKDTNQISTSLQSTEKGNGDDDDDDENERLREIYGKKPYVPFAPTLLETIYSPNKKRNDKNMFGKRKMKRELTFRPSETQIKNRQKKAMRNWPFLFLVPDAEERLDKLLNITEDKTKTKRRRKNQSF